MITSIADSDAAPPRRRRGRPPRLSREGILSAALELVDNEGAQALTMRRLGSALGVEAMSLYRHVANKEALLDSLAERLMAQITVPGGAGDSWEASARGFAIGMRKVARAHPAAFELVALRALCTAEALVPVEQLLAAFRRAGFSPARAVATYRLLSSYARGFALMEVTQCGINSDALFAADFPAIEWSSPRIEAQPSDAHFRSGLDTLLAGVSAAAPARARP
ncbi:MAG: TetR/AcrR family transcriptional regulator C-terminal domain-containing protein [Solirubrobacteraceae bacterium]